MEGLIPGFAFYRAIDRGRVEVVKAAERLMRLSVFRGSGT